MHTRGVQGSHRHCRSWLPISGAGLARQPMSTRTHDAMMCRLRLPAVALGLRGWQGAAALQADWLRRGVLAWFEPMRVGRG
jgi:hypothetical protein